MNFSTARDRVPNLPARQPDRAALICHLTDAGGDCGRIELRNKRNAGLGDRRLFGRDIFESAAKELLMIECKVGDGGHQWAIDDVRGIEPAAQSNLKDASIRG